MSSKIPKNLVEKILMDAMQLRNLELCNEIKQTMKVVNYCKKYFGKRWPNPEYLKFIHEIVISGAPDPTTFKSYLNYIKKYKEWRLLNFDYVYNINWPLNTLGSNFGPVLRMFAN